MRIPQFELTRQYAVIEAEIEAALRRVLRSGRFILGAEGQAFEAECAATLGVEHAIGVASGSDALQLTLRALRVGPGDEVITAAFSFVSSARAVLQIGARPVFADVDRRTFNLDPRAVEAAMTDRTRAVVAVDIYGYPCELDELRALCADRGIALIEDACEALGARYKGRAIGSQGSSAVFAFYPNKQMTTGEGGMVTTHSEDQWRLLRSLRNQGRADSGGWLEHARLGFNYRLDDVRAAMGIGQLEKLDEILASREAVAARYSELLGAIPGLELPCADDPDHERSWFVYVVTLPVETDREAVIARLDAHGIQTARYLPCIHLQPYMQQRFGFEAGLCPVAEELSSRTLALPFHARLGQDDQEYVAAALESALTF